MLLNEPPPTQGDLRFSLFGIPVRVHPVFWLVAVLLGMGANSMIDLLLWVAAVFIAILVHELGHALVMRYYGLRPWITLHGLGGLAGYDTTDLMRSRASGWIAQIIISLAGPGAGFLMAAVIVAVLFASGGGVVPKFFEPPYGFFLIPQGIVSMRLLTLTWALLFVGVTWGLVNLLPIYPLDGGQVAREIFLRFNPRNGLRYSLILSTIAGATMVAICLLPVVQSIRAGLPLLTSLRNGSPFVALLFGYLAYSSYSVLQAMFRPRGPW